MTESKVSGAARAVSGRARARQALAADLAARREQEKRLETGYAETFGALDAVEEATAALARTQGELAVKLRTLTELDETAEGIAVKLGLEAKEVRRLLASAPVAAQPAVAEAAAGAPHGVELAAAAGA